MKPNQVNFHNAQKLWNKLYGNRKTPKNPTLQPEDVVRIARERHIFEKGYVPNFSNETFGVLQAIRSHPSTYVLKNQKGEEVRGRWYKEELAKAKHDPLNYVIQKIRQTRMVNGEKEYLVKWVGQPLEASSWITAKDIILKE